jgi:hypothetical protein
LNEESSAGETGDVPGTCAGAGWEVADELLPEHHAIVELFGKVEFAKKVGRGGRSLDA